MSVTATISAAIVTILEADTTIEQAVEGAITKTMSATPSMFFTWGPGGFVQHSNAALDRTNTLDMWVLGSQEEVNTAIEEIGTIFLEGANFAELRAAGVLRMVPLENDPPINWQKAGMNSGGIRFLVEARFTY